jgi:endonuclease VIII
VPEGDTVWLTARRLDQALAGRIVSRFDLRVPQLALADRRGDTVTEVRSRGKHILMRFAGGSTLHSHLRMDGSWVLDRAGHRHPAGPEHAIRAVVGNEEWVASGYRVHDLRLLPTNREHELIDHLGPDLLGADWDPAEAVRRLQRDPARPIGEALLDQANLAGIGNVYRAEVLFLRGVHPVTPVHDVADLDALVALAHRLMWANRNHPTQSTTGSTARGSEHWVYRRHQRACRRCGTVIVTAIPGRPPDQRRIWWCPTCQPKPTDAGV